MTPGGRSIDTRICRLCLAQTVTHFSLLENNKTSDMLKALTSMQIHSNDVISTVMCYKCHLNVKLAYNIQQNILKAEERFHSLCRTVKEENQIFEAEEPIIKQEPDTYTCKLCQRPFSTWEKYSKHDRNCKKSRRRSKCPICGKEVTTQNLNKHVEIHSSDKVVCELCGATMSTKNSLRHHLKLTHSSAKIKCRYCARIFKRQESRDVHEKKEHLGEANFVCDTCGKRFYKSYYLKSHVKMKHLKLRPFVCDVCKNAFSSKYALTTHRRQHTKETPYKCEVCGEGFRQKVSLKTHLKSKHDIEEEIMCNCDVCGKGFGSKGALHTHNRRVHDV